MLHCYLSIELFTIIDSVIWTYEQAKYYPRLKIRTHYLG